MLDRATAARFAALTLGHLCREWPNILQHAMTGPEEVRPSTLHPIFYGSYDWHSCVHGWWQVMRLARRFPDLATSAEARALADACLIPAAVAGELAYFQRSASRSYERPYGWAWLLALHAEFAHHDAPWAATLEPLARHIAAALAAYLPRLTYPVRHGVHSNTAFALILARDWAMVHDTALRNLIDARARAWFGGDRGYDPREPSGEDFLSPALCEAVLMADVLGDEFAGWFKVFLPEAHTLLEPAIVSDRSDGRLAHLDGLNLSRAWCWRRLSGHARDAEATARRHLEAALPHLADDYMGEHWLATFALLALDDL